MKLLYIIIFLISFGGYAQTISVNDQNNSPNSLANLLLSDGCVGVSNASFSSNQSVASFSNNNGDFPIAEGVIIRSGIAKFSEGSYTGENLSSQLNSNSDPELQEINNSSGQPSLISDVAYFEFDFTPLSSKFSFDFLFASNEYGQWQCVSSDVFAFLLTDMDTGETTNLAVIPETTMPVSVKNIRDHSINSSCSSRHPNKFSTYNVDNSESTLNMRGYTTVMNASANITPKHHYRIKLVIGDSNDANFDSAIFLAAGSFETNIDLGPDQFLCDGDIATLETGLDSNEFEHTWSFNGTELLGEHNSSLSVEQVGTYAVEIDKAGSGCSINDEIVFSDLMLSSPQDLKLCYDEGQQYYYDLTENDEVSLGADPTDYQFYYYASAEDMQNDYPISPSNLTSFQSIGNQQIYIKIFNNNTGHFCSAEYSFDLLINDPVAANFPDDIQTCVSATENIVDLTNQNEQIIGGADADRYFVSYFKNDQDAQANVNPIANPNTYHFSPVTIAAKENQTNRIWARVIDLQFPDCASIVSFQIFENDLPPVDELEDVIECSEYVLPELTYGNYFTGPDGTGDALFAGDIIEDSGTYFIFNGPNEYGCTNQSSFEVILIIEYTVAKNHCGSFTVPSPPVGSFFTALGGPNGNGEELSTGTVIYTDQTIYYYAIVDDALCRDEGMPIDILPIPAVDEPEEVITCEAYTLPELENGNYYTSPNGSGNKLEAGEMITQTQMLYIFADNGPCQNEAEFHVAIIPDYDDEFACGSYDLPPLDAGHYFSLPNGQGDMIAEGTNLNSSQRIYVYAETTIGENCTENLSFYITVQPIPEVSSLEDVYVCEDDLFELPSIENGQYFTQSDREGIPLNAGDEISSTQTIYINSISNTCTNETEFTVEFVDLPVVENFTDVYNCDPYVLPTPTNGEYYTGPAGTGDPMHPGDSIKTTQTLYIYSAASELTTCYAEQAFTVYVRGIVLPELPDVKTCDQYVLPEIEAGNYYTKSGGEGTLLQEGEELTNSQTVYIYAMNGERFICESETSFSVDISITPDIVADFPDRKVCGSYILPAFPEEDFNLIYSWDAEGNEVIQPSDYEIKEPGTYEIYVAARASTNAECATTTSFKLQVYPLKEFSIPDGVVCVDPITEEPISEAYLDSGIDETQYSVKWYYEGELVHTGSDFFTENSGDYEVYATTKKVTTEIGGDCGYVPITVHVDKSSKAIAKARVSEDFSKESIITVSIIEGYGDFEFSLDDGAFQDSPIFRNLKSGYYNVHVKNKVGGCGDIVLEVQIINHPKFFTPNQDGVNDTWNIYDLKDHPEARIRIFDRFGKLLTTIYPSRQGWDGNFNGKAMPSNDFWFEVTYRKDGVDRNYRSHITLKR